MRAVVQRVSQAQVSVGGLVRAHIDKGLLVLVGAAEGDGEEDVRWLAEKVVSLRIFEDPEGKMNLSVEDVGGEVLAVSQFTLLGDCRKGRRPSFSHALGPVEAQRLFGRFIACIRENGLRCRSGVFGAMMQVELTNDGPVTILLDSRKQF